MLMGDINAKVWKEISNNQVAGKYTLPDATCRNGQKLIQFAEKNDVCTEYKNTNIIKYRHG
jgi:hypothetical protein